MQVRWDKRIKAKHFRQFYIQKYKETSKVISKYRKEIQKTLPRTIEDFDFYKMIESFDNSNVSSRDGTFKNLWEIILSPKDKNIVDVNDALFQLTSSVEKLLDIVEYFVSSGFHNEAMSDYKLIRYHIENYLNQNYIVQQRLKRYFDSLKKRYKSNNELKKVGIIDKSYNSLNQKMSGFIRKRGYHVHDQDFRDFLLFGLMNICSAIDTGMKVDKITYRSSVNTIKKIWLLEMSIYNNDLITSLDNVFKTFIEYGIQ